MLLSQRLYDLDYVEVLRAFHNASAAADAGEHALVVFGIVDQLVHESLAESFDLRESRLTRGHTGELGEHAGIPAAVSLNTVTGVIVADIIALAGGANEGAGAAAEACLGELCPLRRAEQLHGLAGAEALCGEVIERGLCEIVARDRLFGFHDVEIGVCGILKNAERIEKSRALFGLCVEIEAVARKNAGNVARRLGGVDAEGVAEAGGLGLAAGNGHDHALFAARLVIGVHGVREEHTVEDAEACCVAGTHAEHDKVASAVAVVNEVDLSSALGGLHRVEVLALREEKILGRLDGVERVGGILGALAPELVGHVLFAADGQV